MASDFKASALSPAVLRAAKTLRIDQVTAEVVHALRARDIPSLLLKGPAVARWLYTDGAVRAYIDTDLLVRSADVERAEETLAELGFTHAPLDDIPGDKPWHGHEWIRMADRAVVDVHRTLIGVANTGDVWDVLSPTAETWQVGGAEVAVLDEPGRALHVALHAAQNGVQGRQSMEDLARALEQVPAPVWEGAAALAERLGATAALGAGLRLLEPGVALADRLGLSARVPVDTVLRAGDFPAVAVGLAWLASRPGVRAKAALVVHKAFPSPAFLRAWTPLARRGRLGLALAYPYRLWWLAAHTPLAVRAWRRARRQASGSPPEG